MLALNHAAPLVDSLQRNIGRFQRVASVEVALAMLRNNSAAGWLYDESILFQWRVAKNSSCSIYKDCDISGTDSCEGKECTRYFEQSCVPFDIAQFVLLLPAESMHKYAIDAAILRLHETGSLDDI